MLFVNFSKLSKKLNLNPDLIKKYCFFIFQQNGCCSMVPDKAHFSTTTKNIILFFHRGAFNECPQHMFLWRKIFTWSLTWSYMYTPTELDYAASLVSFLLSPGWCCWQSWYSPIITRQRVLIDSSLNFLLSADRWCWVSLTGCSIIY